ncbi:MAG: hypothetical protein GY925_26735 [Actinomycetia bacterium]|nr:hypothetical protein [Actinomycetes bacterium]
MDTRDLVKQTSPTLNSAGAAYYFAPETLAKGKEIGLDGFRFYCLGRGGVLGDVEPAVISSAFGYFAAGLVTKIWNSAKEIISPREAARAHLACADDLGRARLGGVEGLDGFCDAAETIITNTDPSGLALFAAVAAEPMPEDRAARAYRNVLILRELRGSVHLISVVAEGLTAVTAHAIKRPDDVATFGHAEPPEIGETEIAALDAAEKRTDDIMTRFYGVLNDAQKLALATGTAAIGAALST